MSEFSDAERYDRELDVDFTPAVSELVDLMRKNLGNWLAYMQSNPPLSDLQANAEEIMAAIQAASGLPGAEELAAELALAVDIKFERLGLWQAWYPRLMSLYAPVAGRPDGPSQGRLYQCLMNYYLHQGDLVRANRVINMLLDIAASDPKFPLQEAMIGAASVIAAMGSGTDGPVLAEQLLDLAYLTGNRQLMGRTFGVLSQYYVHRSDPQHTFEYGQMAYCVGAALDDDHIIINGLHFMALGLAGPRAFPYLKRAMRRSHARGEVSHMMYLRYTWGYCCYLSGRFPQAAHLLAGSVLALAGRGSYYATALYMCGLALMRLERYTSAEEMLHQAIVQWGSRSFEHLYARHALAHVHWLTGNYGDAVRHAEQVIDELRATDDTRSAQLLAELDKDLAKYRAARDGVRAEKPC
jgi:tetratricopeptide (TPR) repeat protein